MLLFYGVLYFFPSLTAVLLFDIFMMKCTQSLLFSDRTEYKFSQFFLTFGCIRVSASERTDEALTESFDVMPRVRFVSLLTDKLFI